MWAEKGVPFRKGAEKKVTRNGISSFPEALDSHEIISATWSAQGTDVSEFPWFNKANIAIKHLYYILENETYTVEIKVSKIKFLCKKIYLYWKGVYR